MLFTVNERAISHCNLKTSWSHIKYTFLCLWLKNQLYIKMGLNTLYVLICKLRLHRVFSDIYLREGHFLKRKFQTSLFRPKSCVAAVLQT